MLSENLNLTVTDETPVSTVYEILHNGKKAGAIEVGKFNKLLDDDALEIIVIKIDDGFSRMGIGTKAVKVLWSAHPNINTLYVMPTEESRAFWEKLGAKRLNNTYYIIQRGH